MDGGIIASGQLCAKVVHCENVTFTPPWGCLWLSDLCVCENRDRKKRWEKIHARGTSFILLQHCVSCELVYFVKGMYQIYIVPRDSGISTLVDVHIIFFVMFQSLSEHSESDFYPAY